MKTAWKIIVNSLKVYLFIDVICWLLVGISHAFEKVAEGKKPKDGIDEIIAETDDRFRKFVRSFE